MKIWRFSFLISSILTLSFFAACGSSGNNTVLTITPAGPTVVLMTDTLAFTASRTDVTWSVQGGDSNGTIDTTGVYTPPATLPTTSPKVLVEADSSDGQVATSEVDLRTGLSLTFGSPVPINDTPISAAATLESLELGGLGDRLAVRLGTVNEVATFAGDNASVVNPFFSQEIDFGGFSTPLNINSSTSIGSFPCAIVEDNNENPGIFLMANGMANARIFFMTSANQGQSFDAPVQVFSDSVVPPNFQQIQAFSRFDDQNTLHLVFAQQDPSTASNPEDIFYSHSTDGGVTWSTPKQVSNSATSETATFPSLAIDSTGKIYVSWQDTNGSNNNVFFSGSSDGGVNFSAPLPLTTSGHINPGRVAVGPSGEIYLAYSDGDGTATGSNVFVIKSTNGGQMFSSPLQINTDLLNNHEGVFPMIAVDSLGRVDVVWGADPDNSGDLNEFMYSRSVNGGGVFSPNQPIVTATNGDNNTGTFILPFGLRHDITGRIYIAYVFGNPTMGFNFDVIHGE